MKFSRIMALGFVLSLAVATSVARADEDGAFLDSPYKVHHHPVRKAHFNALGLTSFATRATPQKSNVEALIAKQTPVKSQGNRGTCSIFSATAILESMLIIKQGFTPKLDLSEEWLQYVIAQNHTTEGSSSDGNFEGFFGFGSPTEEVLKYIGESWEKVEAGTQSEKRCGNLKGRAQKSCLVGHRDPALMSLSEDELSTQDKDFLAARQQAFEMRDQYIQNATPDKGFTVYDTDEVKRLLAKGIPLTVDLDFYYGAWNHREAEELGIPRDAHNWAQGIVGYPLRGSVDRINTKKDPAGHSVVVVGYDDTVEITLKHRMPDGTDVEKTYKGVYYFKNSWGTGKFGADFAIDGVAHPGYGMITQAYAEEFGTFFQLPLK